MTADPWSLLARRPVALACVGAALLGLTGVLFKVSDASPSTATVFRCLYALPVLWALAAFEARRGGAAEVSRRSAWLAGVLLGVDLVLWQRSVTDVGAGLATVLGNTQLVFVVAASAVFLGERPTPALLGAVATMLAGVVLIAGVLEARPYGAHPLRGVAFGVAAGALYAGFIMVVRRAGGTRASVRPLVHATAAAVPAGFLLGWALGDLRLEPTWPTHGWLLLMAVSGQALAWLLLTVPVARLPASTTSLVLTLQPVAGVVYGIVLLTERPSGLQVVGVLITLAGFVVALRARAAAPRATPAIRPGAPRPDRYSRSHA